MKETITHYAFCDESRYNVERYRSIGILSLPFNELESLENEVSKICKEGNVTNIKKFKWENLNSAKMRFAVLAVFKHIIKKAIDKKLRVDVLIWDIKDSRHNIVGRDDSKNLAKMYYHLIKDVILKRWPEGGVWNIFPDRQNIINWKKLEEILETKSRIIDFEGSEVDKFGFRNFKFRNKFTLRIKESTPSKKLLIQISDLFAGMAVYSRKNYKKFEQWKSKKKETTLSIADKERCNLIEQFDNKCKKNKLGVSIKTTKGLKTFNPEKPINFWLYEPQYEEDKATTKQTYKH